LFVAPLSFGWVAAVWALLSCCMIGAYIFGFGWVAAVWALLSCCMIGACIFGYGQFAAIFVLFFRCMIGSLMHVQFSWEHTPLHHLHAS
jgi:hypothetical protein